MKSAFKIGMFLKFKQRLGYGGYLNIDVLMKNF